MDARRLPPPVQEDLRRRVVAAVEGGLSQARAAQEFGVSRRSVGIWVRAHRDDGPEALRARRRGRSPADRRALDSDLQAAVLGVLIAGPPEESGLAHPLWNRRALVELIERQSGIRVTLAAAGQYLLRWGILGHRTAVVRATAIAPPRVGGRRTSRETFLTGWSRLALPSAESGHSAPVQALLAQNASGGSYFLLSRSALDLEALADFGERIAATARAPVHLMVVRWPREHEPLLRTWMCAPKVLVRVTLA